MRPTAVHILAALFAALALEPASAENGSRQICYISTSSAPHRSERRKCAEHAVVLPGQRFLGCFTFRCRGLSSKLAASLPEYQRGCDVGNSCERAALMCRTFGGNTSCLTCTAPPPPSPNTACNWRPPLEHRQETDENASSSRNRSLDGLVLFLCLVSLLPST